MITLPQKLASITGDSVFAYSIRSAAETDPAGCIQMIKDQALDNYPLTEKIVGKNLLTEVLLQPCNLLISLYDHSGNASRPYREAGWQVIQVDIKHGIDIMTWDYTTLKADRVGIIIMQPCTCYALCGNRHKETRLASGEFGQSQMLVETSRQIIEYFNPFFWQLENPKTDIHKKNQWIGQRPKFIFNPCDFAGYDPVPDDSRYNKETWLFGKFNDPARDRLEPIEKDNPGWKNLGGKSERTKELRSITPLGFAYAFYKANH